MIPLNSSYLRGRHVLLRSLALPRLINIPSRYSSLSAIHRGLRDSEKARPQGFKQASLNSARPARTPQHGRSPHPARSTFKISKGKKDITDKDLKAKSRRARFYDPDESFGKKSLVYQLKTSALRERLSEIGEKERRTTGGRNDRLSTTQFMNDFKSSSGRQSSQDKNVRATNSFTRDRRLGAPVRSRPSSRFTQPSDGPRPSNRFDSTSKSNTRPARTILSSREDRVESQDSHFSRERQTDNRDDSTSFHQSPPRDVGPVRIHHTTAASQFLYGRSVVEAALKDTKRQLYKLYLYCGENRQKISQIAGLETWANRCGVLITKVEDRDGLRMMDKMSDGRPHNGCVLEASPLPQLPLKALGAVSEDPAKPGFSLELAHQSREEAQVNGAPDFIKTQLPAGRRPFVLLLDKILDPGNLGAILRSAAFLGVNAVAITKGSSATITSVALKASAGASEVLTIFSVNSTIDFLTRSKESGWMVYAAVPSFRSGGNKQLTLDRVESFDPLSVHPTILVVGSEGEGLEKRVRRTADYEVSIPNNSGLNMVDSLNVSVAAGVLCTSFLKKQYSESKFDENVLEAQEDESQLW
ncbi:Alpha/beta knot methyltransferase [Hypoxylon rubiginosum]|uniref:Alpha/beta knot methyltransferase n=1 Tax=Hypoxylon rubiginosum TaxID=110542 RepID=A0ACC0DBL9_9PEZI|nr:Alpha/beta knot methyltransferase [Hypoxylon rubiginosum]